MIPESPIRIKGSSRLDAGTAFLIGKGKMIQTLIEPSKPKPIEYGSGIIVKELEDKILITAQCRTRLKEGNFLLEADHITIEAGPGIKISSKGKDTLVISCNLTSMEESIFDFKKEIDARLQTIEKVFTKILKQVKS